jgi:hypothetical protein
LPQVPNQKRRKQHQRYVFFSLESPFHEGVDFNIPRYDEKELDFNNPRYGEKELDLNNPSYSEK